MPADPVKGVAHRAGGQPADPPRGGLHQVAHGVPLDRAEIDRLWPWRLLFAVSHPLSNTGPAPEVVPRLDGSLSP